VDFQDEPKDGGIEISFRVSEKEYEILKYAGQYGYSNGSHSPVSIILRLLHYEMLTLEYHSGEVQKYRWKLMLDGKDPHIDLRETHPELFVRSGGIIRDRKIPNFKPRLPALLTYEDRN